eukprot:996558-Pelagomonas_calceolata.AAC.1
MEPFVYRGVTTAAFCERVWKSLKCKWIRVEAQPSSLLTRLQSCLRKGGEMKAKPGVELGWYRTCVWPPFPKIENHLGAGNAGF